MSYGLDIANRDNFVTSVTEMGGDNAINEQSFFKHY
jgi:hypothetical protein